MIKFLIEGLPPLTILMSVVIVLVELIQLTLGLVDGHLGPILVHINAIRIDDRVVFYRIVLLLHLLHVPGQH